MPHDHNLRIFLSKHFQTGINFAVVFIINQKFNIVLKSTHGLYLQIIKTLCPVKLEIF